MRTWRSAMSSHLALAAFSSARTSTRELVDQAQAMGAHHQLVDQPAEMLAVDAEMRQRLLVGADAAHVLEPVFGGFAGEALGAVLEHAGGRRLAAVLLAEHVGEDRAEIDRGAARLGDLARHLAVLALRLVARRAGGGDAQVDVAQRRVGDLQRGDQLAEQLLLDAGRRGRAARCGRDRASWRGSRRRRRCGSRPAGRPGDGAARRAGRAPGRA